jgi:hypothetical protein
MQETWASLLESNGINFFLLFDFDTKAWGRPENFVTTFRKVFKIVNQITMDFFSVKESFLLPFSSLEEKRQMSKE